LDGSLKDCHKLIVWLHTIRLTPSVPVRWRVFITLQSSKDFMYCTLCRKFQAISDGLNVANQMVVYWECIGSRTSARGEGSQEPAQLTTEDTGFKLNVTLWSRVSRASRQMLTKAQQSDFFLSYHTVCILVKKHLE
jgi:hypothetical protein